MADYVSSRRGRIVINACKDHHDVAFLKQDMEEAIDRRWELLSFNWTNL